MEMFVIIWFMLFGMGVDTEYGPGVVAPVECVGIACEAEHDNGPPDASRRPPAPPGVPDVPDAPDDDPHDDDDGKPGHGHGDKNHDHNGPPGRNK